MKTHPPTLLKLAERCLRDEIRLPRGARVLVATSGGPDSMALLDALAALQTRPSARSAGAGLDFSIVAHGVDHGLREAAARELDLAEAHAKSLGVSFARTKVDVAPGGDLQARARRERHAALERARQRANADFIATAHHAGDRAETVLLRILRGAGASGLAVLPARDENLVRPLIRARRADVLLHLERHHVPFANDPSNSDPRFLRVRVRREVLPLLESLDPNVVAHLCALADDLAAAREDGSGLYRIPRTARVALAALASGKKPRATVLLPGGLVVKKAPRKTTS